MKDFFLLMYATCGSERNYTRFERYDNVSEAVEMVQEWLSKNCCMDCYPAGREEQLRAENGGQLPESAFLCPEVKEPKDLEQYNGFYDYESLGMFNLFLTPVYDLATARKFRGGMIKEFGIDQEYSDRSDQMMDHLRTFVEYFEKEGEGVQVDAAFKEMQTFLLRGGFSLFDDDVFSPDSMVIPSDGSAPFAL